MRPDRPPEYDAVVLVSFGGPEGPDDVMPFLTNVTSGLDIPARRLEAVAEQYLAFGGVSPINAQCRRLRDALEARLRADGLTLPVHWGNRNWAPYLAETVAEMAQAGRRRVLAVVTSAYSSFSGCRQYLNDIEAARAHVGDGAPAIHKIRAYHDHPGFVEPFADSVAEARLRLPEGLREDARLVFTAHSIPASMARGCAYERQLRETARLVAQRSGFDDWRLAWQSRSGPPSVPWLEPDINDCLHRLADSGASGVLVAPIGFVADHMEVLWDLDVAAAETAEGLGLRMERAVTPGTGPDARFVAMLSELVQERFDPKHAHRSLGRLGTGPDFCSSACCPRSA